ncbi:putative protein downstream neighbor of Son [Scophthalmus maximus]|uniref:Protein downstream neighbor of Son n=1 Tax=Scophthalmus maximus TaxID=52904 RepID=A0A2U9AW84_SCOMX|nr:putative protein downstream neighbor of Son [Scophthalmus maximus]
MSQQAGYSPSFKRPAEIMRMRRKRARSDAGACSGPSGRDSAGSPRQSGSSPACVRPFSPGPLFSSGGGGGTKRRNPFANIENTHSPRKKFLIYNDDGEAEASDSPKAIRCAEREAGEDVSTKRVCQGVLSFRESLTEAEKQQQREISSKSPQAIAPASIAPPVCTEYPADWSLKTRLLFTSPLSLSWAEQPKAQEEALGLSQHCRAQFSTLPHSLQDPKSCSELRSAFQQSLVYWQHPSLPWISLFPRINAERSFAGKSTPWAQDTSLQQSLMREWSVSLSSLYSLLKARLCPYFYICSYQFTVLFRAAGLGGSAAITALISPTTRGLREAMKAEGPQCEREKPGWFYVPEYQQPGDHRTYPPLLAAHHHNPSSAIAEGKLLSYSLHARAHCCHEHRQATVYRWLGGPVRLRSPSRFRPAAATAPEPGQHRSDAPQHEQLQLHLEELKAPGIITFVHLQCLLKSRF